MPKRAEEIAITIPLENGFLAGTLHMPVGRKPRGGWPAVMLCHGFTGNRIEAHFMFVKASREFARLGLASLRFDFRGSGESSGDFQEVSILTELADALAAWQFLGCVKGIDIKRRALLGLSLGGAVASLLAGGLAGEKEAPACVALWSAVADIKALWVKRLQQIKKASGRKSLTYPVSHSGLEVGRRFFDDIAQVPLPSEAIGVAGVPTLIVHGEGDTVIPTEQAQAFKTACGSKLATLKIFKHMDHTFAEPGWERKVIAVSAKWLIKKLERSETK